MENKVFKLHVKGQKHIGKTNWNKVSANVNKPIIDEENPELVGKKQFRKVKKPTHFST